jgi:Pro-kumamolisin, activation domain/Abnormal spindle-like microcephaly-assoc'd, ASPM-SPD-2-Hydin
MFVRKAFSPKRSLFAAIAFVISVSVAGMPAFSAPRASIAPRIVEQVDETRLTTLHGNTRPEARAEFDRGVVEPQLVLGDLILVLQRGPAEQAAFDAFLASQQDTSSPNYHHWLSPEEIGAKFGPAQTDIDTISNWLKNQGFNVTEVSKDHMSIRFDGLASQVQRAFHTEIHNLQVRGESHIANMSDPQIPEALTPVVLGVKALHNFFPHPLHKQGPGTVRRNANGTWDRIATNPVENSKTVAPRSNAKEIPAYGTANGIEDVAPYDFATIYNVLPLWNATTPINGTGQTIAIVGTSNIKLADVATFKSAFGLPAGLTPIFYPGNTDPGDCSPYSSACAGDLIENTLDVEWSGAVAPGAQIILVGSVSTTTSTDPVYTSANYIVNNTNGKINAKIMNVSYGECELGLGTAGNASYNTLWSTAQMNGIAVFVSTGDSGSASCDDDQSQNGPYGAQYGLSVSGVASTPYNVAVGGTDFIWGWETTGQTTYWNTTDNSTNTSNAKGYIPEFPWNSSCANTELVASINKNSGTSLTPGEVCDEAGDGEITNGGSPVYYLVNTDGGSGGASNCINGDTQNTSSCTKGYAKPSFQAGVTGIPSDGVRDIPDVSFFAANGFSGSSYVICVSAAGSCSYTQGTEPTGEEYGGTSISSPAMAGVMALINQKAGSAQGNPNTALYKLAAKETYSGCKSENIPLTGSSCVFNDIDEGSIIQPCAIGSLDCTSFTNEIAYSVLSGWSATAGYDLASGLGSINVANLVNTFAPATTSPTATLSPTSLSFSSTTVGNSAATQTIKLSNTGTAAMTITGVSITGTNSSSFTQTNNCPVSPATMAVNGSCTITVTFTPQAGGTLTASVSVADNASGSPQSATLTGIGFVPGPIATLSPTSLSFPNTVVAVPSASMPVTLTNTGTLAMTISSIAIGGTDATSFAQTNNCGTGLAIGAFCTINVTFTPATFGTTALSGTVVVTDNAPSSPQSVTLSGTGTEAGSFTLAASAVTVAPGSSAQSAVTATGANGYSTPNTITLSNCKLATSPAGATDLPTCSISGATVTFASGGSTGSGGQITIGTTAPSSNVRKQVADSGRTTTLLASAGGAALAGLLFFGIPARRRIWRSLFALCFFAGMLGVLSGCGGGSGGGGGGTSNPGTTAGAYTFTATGTDSDGATGTVTIAVTVN